MKKLFSLIFIAVILILIVPAVHAENETYKAGDIIQFGSYPQSEVKDEALIDELNALAPEWEDWTSYGYYSGTGDGISAVQGEWMKYVDIEYKDQKYRGVKFVQYRPSGTPMLSSIENSVQDDMGYYVNEIYWFLFESINWQIIAPDEGLVVSQIILDAQPYCNLIYMNSNIDGPIVFNDISYANYANHYETSSIRRWLNTEFINTAFTDKEQKKIGVSTINNEGYLRLAGKEESWIETFGDILLFNYRQTQDKVYLLPYNGTPDKNLAKGSSYARCQGLAEDDIGAMWLLRTAGINTCTCCGVGGDLLQGDMQAQQIVYAAFYGIRPALNLKNIENFDEPIDPDEPNDTHDKPGLPITPTEPEENQPTEHEHIYDDDEDEICNICGFDRTENCSCNCHSGGISGFFFKIINFFQKLFGMNKVCACGVKH